MKISINYINNSLKNNKYKISNIAFACILTGALIGCGETTKTEYDYAFDVGNRDVVNDKGSYNVDGYEISKDDLDKMRFTYSPWNSPDSYNIIYINTTYDATTKLGFTLKTSKVDMILNGIYSDDYESLEETGFELWEPDGFCSGEEFYKKEVSRNDIDIDHIIVKRITK